MKAAAIRLIQQCLVSKGIDPGGVDGQIGTNTSTAVTAALTKRAASLPGDWEGWSRPRRAVAYLQFLCQERGGATG